MFMKTLTIARNTFTETVRQPIFLIIIIVAILTFIISPSITMYTLDDDNRLLRELGLSTLFLSGLFIAIFSSTGAIAEELDSKTAITVLSKPVPRPVFILGKFLGVASAVSVAHFICTAAMLMMIRHGCLERALDEYDTTVLVSGAFFIVLTFIVSAYANYSYDKSFISSSVFAMCFFGILSLVFLSLIDKNWKYNPAHNEIATFDVYASILLLFAVLILVGVAVMFSTRFNVVMTLVLTVTVFMIGLIADYVFGQLALKYAWADYGRLIFPNFQVFWVSDALIEDSQIPFSYLLRSSLYSILYTTGVLSLSTAMFQRRQVG